MRERELHNRRFFAFWIDSPNDYSQLQKVNQELIDQARTIRSATELLIDLYSTHSDMFGDQEQTDYNAHYQIHDYHPLVAFKG